MFQILQTNKKKSIKMEKFKNLKGKVFLNWQVFLIYD